MSTDKAAISEALQSMNHEDATLWTDDGAPRVDVVQRLCNDDKLTRAQINDALPGFVRVTEETKKVDDALAAADAEKQAVAQAEQDKLGFAKPAEKVAKVVEHDSELEGEDPLSESETRAILQRRVRTAEEAVTEAKRALSEAGQEVVRCEKRLQRAHTDQRRYFPPITQAQAIKAHLDSEQKRRHENVKGEGTYEGQSQLDQAMQRSNKRGWVRPAMAVKAA